MPKTTIRATQAYDPDFLSEPEHSERHNSIVTFTENTTITDTHSIILCNTTAGDITLTLPPVSKIDFHIKKIDTSVNKVIIVGNSGATIDGNVQLFVSTPNECVRIAGDAAWYVVSRYRTKIFRDYT